MEKFASRAQELNVSQSQTGGVGAAASSWNNSITSEKCTDRHVKIFHSPFLDNISPWQSIIISCP